MVESPAAVAGPGHRASDDDVRRAAFTAARIAQWDRVARSLDRLDRWNRAYHQRLRERYRWLIPAGRRVLEIGCGPGDLLAAVEPAIGVGVDFSADMLAIARKRHPDLRFVQADVHDLALGDTFDYIILSDVINDVWDVQRVFEQICRHSGPHTRIVLNIHSHLWALPLRVVKALGLSRPMLEQSWLTVDDVANLLRLADCEIVQQSTEVLWPFATPGIAALCNRWLAKMWPFSIGALTHVIVARPFGQALPGRRA